MALTYFKLLHITIYTYTYKPIKTKYQTAKFTHT